MKQPNLSHNILYANAVAQQLDTENLATENVLTYLINGKSKTILADRIEVRVPGSITLIRRNTVLKTIKYPEPDGRPYQSLSIFLDRPTLEKISVEENFRANTRYTGEPSLDFTSGSLLQGFFASLVPYFIHQVPLTALMAELKTREAVQLLLRQDSHLKNFLFDFSDPIKIELATFMERHYIYRLPIAEFARLTGRSVATFKRDFKKVFANTPERWIRQKRLERAHLLLAKQKTSPAIVYREVGFENLSHFSVAFKKYFGYNPSSLP